MGYFSSACARRALPAVALLVACLPAAAQAGPQAAPLPPPIAAPLDSPYPGAIALLVNATDSAHRVLDVYEQIPAQGTSLTLLYPQWIPGNHSPSGPIARISGLEFTAGATRLTWRRDPVDVFAIHVTIPAGVASIQAHYEYLAPAAVSQGRVSFDHNLIDLSWNTVVLYPAGHFSRRIAFSPSIVLPAGWKFATALQAAPASAPALPAAWSAATQGGDLIHFDEVPLNTLVDSPLYAGVNYERLDLSSSPANQVFLNVFADTPAELAVTPEELQLHKNLVAEAAKLFGSRHYRQYDFLLTLSGTIGGEGLEHHQSSEDGTDGSYFTNWDAGNLNRDLLAHEYTHSWNGKFRRPYDLWTPNFNVPMQDDLLWVYEGLTQYWGYVLTARAGMRTPDQTRELFARLAVGFEDSRGRDWRPLLDTTNQPTMSQRAAEPWTSWMRAEDYYTEGLLIWLDADTKIRQLSHGAKSLDDFARGFFGVDDGSIVTRTYTFDELVKAMNAVQPYDWAGFFDARVNQIAPHPPEDGITQGGYQLVYNDDEPDWMRPTDPLGINLGTSLGFSATSGGAVVNVWWASPAFQSGMSTGMQITKIGGDAFSLAGLRAAVVAAENGTASIQLTLRGETGEQTISLNYHGGFRFPHLERQPGAPDLLDAILQP